MKLLCARCHGSGLIDEIDLPRIHGRILQAIRETKGITAPDLVDRVYGCEEDGGPVNAILSIQVTILRLNRRMKGFRIKATKKGRGALYRLEKL